LIIGLPRWATGLVSFRWCGCYDGATRLGVEAGILAKVLTDAVVGMDGALEGR
jgi:hypothetical protein